MSAAVNMSREAVSVCETISVLGRFGQFVQARTEHARNTLDQARQQHNECVIRNSIAICMHAMKIKHPAMFLTAVQQSLTTGLTAGGAGARHARGVLHGVEAVGDVEGGQELNRVRPDVGSTLLTRLNTAEC